MHFPHIPSEGPSSGKAASPDKLRPCRQYPPIGIPYGCTLSIKKAASGVIPKAAYYVLKSYFTCCQSL